MPYSNDVHSGFHGDVEGVSSSLLPLFLSLTRIKVPEETLDAKFMPHDDDTIDFLETSGLLRGYPPPSYPVGGLNQTTPDSPLWIQLAFTKTHQPLWRQSVAHNPSSLRPAPSRGSVTSKQTFKELLY